MPSIPSAEEEIFELMLSVHSGLSKRFEDYFRGEFTSLELNTLCVLCAGGPFTTTKLAEILHIPRQQMSRTVEKLYERGCIERGGCEEDRRKLLITVSPRTAENIRACRHRFAQEVREALRGCGSTEYQKFLTAAEVVNRMLTRIPKKS